MRWLVGLLLIVAFALAAVVVALLVELRRRRQRILRLVELLDEALANPLEPQTFDEYREGDLEVLGNALHKTCGVLRDQALGLRRERDGLAENLANIAHQLRTPLSGMDLALELLARPDTDPDRRRDLVRELRGLARHTGWLCNALLTFARADAGVLELARARVDVADLVRAAAAPLAVAYELKGVELVVEGAEAGVWFEGDAGWSTEALANVLKNCLEHTPAGGTVRVGLAQDAVAARIEVEDTGCGIDPADLPRVFDRFYRGRGGEARAASGEERPAEKPTPVAPAASATPAPVAPAASATPAPVAPAASATPAPPAATPAPPAASSAGIGLALARCLTLAQGGTLVAANVPAGGARFTFSFPRTTL